MVIAQKTFIRVKNAQFELNGKPYYFLGTNFWYGMNLGSSGEGGNRLRLLRELDHLATLGVTNLRIMAASEGPDNEPWRMLPSLQTEPGVYNQEVLEGLDFLLAEMGKRNMYAVVCLGNFWPWSGGMAQYVKWTGKKAIPYPPPAKGGDWSSYQLYTSSFYTNEEAIKAYQDHLTFILNRVNSITDIPYKDDPTIMSWQLANEPRGILKAKAYRAWVNSMAAYIKSLDSNHLVTIGSEGRTPSRLAGTNPRKDHLSEDIDYMTFHIWIQNWGWYNPEKHAETYASGLKAAKKYITKHLRAARSIGKPIVLEEFGIARDLNDHDPNSPTRSRDQYYADMFEEVFSHAAKASPFAGCNFWAWGGEGRPREPHAIWKPQDDFIGDPPHEHQGWYSIYNADTSTLEVISRYALKMNDLCK